MSKVDKKAARASLKALKDVREGKVNRLEQLELDEDEDVYDVVDEEKYAQIVEERRNAGDFVVDDDGLGYFDNGEEVLGVGEEAYEAKKRLQAASGDDRISKKARRLAEESGMQKNSILKHLQPGLGPSRGAVKEKAPQNLLDIDALLGDGPSTSGPSKSAFNRPVATFRPPAIPTRPIVVPKFSLSGRSAASHADSMDVDEYPASGGDHYEYNDEYPATGEEQPATTQESPEKAASTIHVKQEAETQPLTDVAEDKIILNKEVKKLKAFVPPPSSVPVQVKQEAARALTDISRNTENIFGEQDAPQAVNDVSGKIDAQQWILSRTNADGTNENYLRMYWIDAVENNGLIYLFGRVPITEANGEKRFVSSCVIVSNCERNLFVLPKVIPGEYPKRYDFGKVNSEISSILVPNVIPRQQGRTHKTKVVKRNYAFEHKDVPREETQYLKVVYSAKYPPPPMRACEGGNTYERIFGSTSSALELFILKRKLSGPCWIEIKNPVAASDSVSWCKTEAHVENPKFITRVTEAIPPAPPLVSMCISIKTAVNPTSHMHEIVSISGVVHPKVDSDADSEINPAILRRFTYVRQLGLSCGNAYPASFPHDIAQEVRTKGKDIAMQTLPNERALLSLFLSRIQQEDPDIFASHNLLGFEFDVLLNRAVANKLPNWSILGKLRKSKPPKSVNDRDAIPGRILCDTYKAAKEFLRETTYSLTHLAMSQLKLGRQEIDPIDVPKYFSSSADICSFARHTFWDAWLVQGLMFKLQVVPLTKQLTNLSGNLWSRTIRGARAERIEYLLLHEFHKLKYVLPERKQSELAASKKSATKVAAMEDDAADEDGGGGKVGGLSRKRAKAAYAGGLVLEPKKGLYDSYILLLDFNSLYPSIIQEYNLCFTTVDWASHMAKEQAQAEAEAKRLQQQHQGLESEDESAGEDDAGDGTAGGADVGSRELAALPETDAPAGVLPRVIKTLVDRRRQVKNLLKNERDPVQRQQLDIRQKALKLTANSMYGCLGFSFSRFYARPIAALVTSKGREALQRTVDLATNQLQLDVIYGDTDSVMINTNLRRPEDLPQVKELGLKVKREVNKLYKSLELDLDGIFRSMLLLKKKKYAALVVEEHPDGRVSYDKEMKGLDLVRRDWCVLSKETGKYVVDQILMENKTCEEIVTTIHEHLATLADQIRKGEIPLEKFVITKGLNKNPKDYPDCNGQAHLQVALAMLKANKPVNIGDHIPYVICQQGPVGGSVALRAYHPDEVLRAPTEYTIDYEWYLTNQILPPIARLCEPIEGTSPAILSEHLGLDTSKYARSTHQDDDIAENNWGFVAACMMADEERFKDCKPLTIVCDACHDTVTVTGVMGLEEGCTALTCGKCGAMFYGRKNAAVCFFHLSNRLTMLMRECLRRYYDYWLVCDDHGCGRRTMQQSVRGLACTGDCHGRMVEEYSAKDLYTQMKYLETLFDIPRMKSKRDLDDRKLEAMIPKESKHYEAVNALFQHMSNIVKTSAYNWVRPSLWSSLFGAVTASVKTAATPAGK